MVKILPTPMGFPLILPSSRGYDGPSNKKLRKTEPVYKEYCALIKKHFKESDGLYELKYQDNDDPWSPGNYYIIRKISRAGWRKVVLGDRNIAVMQIMCEPKFAEGHSDKHLPCVGLEIRIADPEYKKIILKFAEEYESMFREKIKIR